MTRRSKVGRAGLVALAGLFSLAWLVPLAMVVGASVKSESQFNDGGYFGLGGSLQQLVANVSSAAEQTKLWSAFANSVMYGLVGAGAAVVISALAAYGLVWLRIRGSFLLFMLIYVGTVLPFQMYIIPVSFSFKLVGLFNTHAGLALFYTTICIPFCTFVFRSYFLGVDPQIIEAAKLDGASSFGIFAKILAPQAISPAVLLFLTQFTWVWNDLLFGQVLATSTGVRPIMPAIAQLSGNIALGSIPERMSGALVASVPSLLLFLILRKRFMQGFALQAR